MTKKVAQNVTNSNSENLTELYQKGKLPKGYYYLKKPDGKVMIITPSLRFMVDGYSILAEVPSFEQWQQLKEYERVVTSYNMKPIDYDVACETVNKLLDERKVLKEENTKLKELLKECRNKWVCYKPYDRDQLLKRIDQVLANNKIQANTVACNKIQENE